MSQTKAPLKKMRELLHAGLRLGTEMPQVEQLRTDIRTREWEDSARKARLHSSVQREGCFSSVVMEIVHIGGVSQRGLPHNPVILSLASINDGP